MWRFAGDTATDYNHYTKRLILSGVYGSTLLVWLDDQSEGWTETGAFLDRRLADVMRFEKWKADWRGNDLHRPSLTRFLGPAALSGPLGPRFPRAAVIDNRLQMTGPIIPLDQLKLGVPVRESRPSTGTALGESEASRLRHFGFDEGVSVEPLHLGPFGRDPLAVRVGRMTVAIRRVARPCRPSHRPRTA